MKEKTAHDVFVQDMIEQIEGQQHGQIVLRKLKRLEEMQEKTTRDVKEVSKRLDDNILVYVKAVMVRKIKYVNVSQWSNHPKEMEQDLGNYKAGDIRRPISILPSHDENYTSTHNRE